MKLKKIKIDLKLRKLNNLVFLKKDLYKSFFKNTKLSLYERQYLKLKYLKFNYKYSKPRIQNFCILTERTHSVYKSVKLSRHSFKSLVLNGRLPGCI